MTLRKGQQIQYRGRNYQIDTVDRNSECSSSTRLFLSEIVTRDGCLEFGQRVIVSEEGFYRSQGLRTERQRELYHRDQDFGPDRRPLNSMERRELETGEPDPNYVAMQRRIAEQARKRRT